MPFVAESIWQALNEAAFERGLPGPEPAAESVTIAAWPKFPAAWEDAAAEQRIGRMQALVRSVREVRNRYNLDPRLSLDVSVRCPATVADEFRTLAPFITQLAGAGTLACGADAQKPANAAGHITPDFEMYTSLAGLVDLAAERQRLEKQRAEKKKFLQGLEAKLANENFVKNAPSEVVQQQRDKVAEVKNQIATLEANIQELG
jgi:valyl-tRNA synthetase